MKSPYSLFTNLLIVLLIAFLTNVQNLKAQETNWPQFRGPNSSGNADENCKPPVEFGTDNNLLWKVELPVGHSSPCIWGDNIFLTGFIKENKELQTICINRNTGKVKWRQSINPEKIEKYHVTSNAANATAATDGERVVFYFGSSGLHCYNFDGEIQWKFPLAVPKSRHGMGTSPVITGDLVILNCFGYNNEPCLLAVNKYDGKVIWEHSLPVLEGKKRDSYSTPVIYKNQAIIYRNEDIAAYDLVNGEIVWKYVLGDMSDAICTPVIGKDVLYTTVFSTLGNPLMREQFPAFKEMTFEYDVNGDNLLSKEEIAEFEFIIYPEKGDLESNKHPLSNFFFMWDLDKDNFIDSLDYVSTTQFFDSFHERQGVKAIKLGGQGDISLDNFLWGYSDHIPHVTSPLFYNNNLYMVKSGGILSCFQAESGELLFQERLGASGSYFSSPVAVDGKIYFASRNGIITVVKAGNKLNILAKNDLDEKISATPAIIGNTLYVRTAGNLYAFKE
ncbi:MAG: PQQ-binding-like beta-propeller repeat protein [Bacteroidetes bacterium]|nr:PQQ-binding-like beta-propeller repeat protein [Bacteroidota bacterium]